MPAASPELLLAKELGGCSYKYSNGYCLRPISRRGLCSAHYQRRKNGKPMDDPVRIRQHRSVWISSNPDRPAYAAAHMRVRAERGPAKNYSCIVCGSQAMDWSYDGDDPNELYGPVKSLKWSYYSKNPSYYSPMCRKCHVAEDKKNVQQELKDFRTLLYENGLTFEELETIVTQWRAS